MKHVNKLDISFDLDQLLIGLDQILDICDWHPTFNQIGLNHGLDHDASNAWYDGAGSLWYYWDESGNKIKRPVRRKEADFVHFVKEFDHTPFRNVYDMLSVRYTLGRMRLMMTQPRSCLSWHVDDEPRLHIPLITNPGAHLVIEDAANHLPADGSAYMANTVLHHTAFNGGDDPRIHLVVGILSDVRA